MLSAAINGVMSMLAFAALFGLNPAGEIAAGSFVRDFLVQGLAVGLMATAVPGALACRAVARGAVAAEVVRVLSGRGLLGRIAGHAAIAAVAGAALWWFALGAMHVTVVPLAAALAIKGVYGAALGAAITAVTLRPRARRGADRAGGAQPAGAGAIGGPVLTHHDPE